MAMHKLTHTPLWVWRPASTPLTLGPSQRRTRRAALRDLLALTRP